MMVEMDARSRFVQRRVPCRWVDRLVFGLMLMAVALHGKPEIALLVISVLLWCYVRHTRRAAYMMHEKVAQQSALHEKCSALETCVDECASLADTLIATAPKERLFDLPQ